MASDTGSPFPIQEFLRRHRAMRRMIADVCGIGYAAVMCWEHVPQQHLNVVSRLLDIPREELRPDLLTFFDVERRWRELQAERSGSEQSAASADQREAT